MTAAIFGLIGVALGGLITASATYLMERRKAWTAARAAGLQLLADLEHALTLVEIEATELALKALATTAREAWPDRREALLFRPGTFPSGLKSDEWLRLAESFTYLEMAAVHHLDPDGAEVHAKAALQILGVFRPDRPAPIQSLSRLLRIQRTPAEDREQEAGGGRV